MVDHSSKIGLRYALRNGLLVNVREFEELRGTKKRPTDIYCPECDAQVTVKLSEEHKMVDHFAHYPDSQCPLKATGESAIHFNAKAYLAQRTKEYHKATLIHQCRGCQGWYPILRIDDYDNVLPEFKIKSRRPDVAFLSSNQPIGAAEICHTHAVDSDKRKDLNATGLSWFEIPALSVRPQHFKFIEAADVISIDAASAGVTWPTVDTPYCDVCAKHRAQQLQEAREIAERRRRDQEAWELEQRYKVGYSEAFAAATQEERLQWATVKDAVVERLEVEKRTAIDEAERKAREAQEQIERLRAERQAYLTSGSTPYVAESGEVVIPTNTPAKYQYWHGGQSVMATLAEIEAPLPEWERLCARNDSILTRHETWCKGGVSQLGVITYCTDCRYFTSAAQLN